MFSHGVILGKGNYFFVWCISPLHFYVKWTFETKSILQLHICTSKMTKTSTLGFPLRSQSLFLCPVPILWRRAIFSKSCCLHRSFCQKRKKKNLTRFKYTRRASEQLSWSVPDTKMWAQGLNIHSSLAGKYSRRPLTTCERGLCVLGRCSHKIP